jgi:alpha-galactosidase
MKPVVDYVHSKGLSFGLYTCGGTQTCVGGRVGSMGFWTEDAESYASWGVDWVKMDWCNNQGQEPKVAYAKMSAALNATGRPIGEHPRRLLETCARHFPNLS